MLCSKIKILWQSKIFSWTLATLVLCSPAPQVSTHKSPLWKSSQSPYMKPLYCVKDNKQLSCHANHSFWFQCRLERRLIEVSTTAARFQTSLLGSPKLVYHGHHLSVPHSFIGCPSHPSVVRTTLKNHALSLLELCPFSVHKSSVWLVSFI
jgi:hypothetical protein